MISCGLSLFWIGNDVFGGSPEALNLTGKVMRFFGKVNAGSKAIKPAG